MEGEDVRNREVSRGQLGRPYCSALLLLLMLVVGRQLTGLAARPL